MVSTLYIFVIIISVLISLSAKAGANDKIDVQDYLIVFKGDTVGNFTVTKTIINDTVIYQYNSVAETRFIKRYHVVSHKETKFYNNQLIYSEASNIVNGKTRDKSITKWIPQKKHYLTNKNGNIIESNRPITFTSVRMFFEQPVNEKVIFSEVRANFDDVKAIENNAYEVDYGFKGNMTYYYENGESVKLVVEYFIVDFEMYRIN